MPPHTLNPFPHTNQPEMTSVRREGFFGIESPAIVAHLHTHATGSEMHADSYLLRLRMTNCVIHGLAGNHQHDVRNRVIERHLSTGRFKLHGYVRNMTYLLDHLIEQRTDFRGSCALLPEIPN